MKRKGPAKPHTAPLTDATAPEPPSVEDQLQAALNANATLVRLFDGVMSELDKLRLAIAGALQR